MSDPFNQAIEAEALLQSPTLGRSCCRVTIGRGEFHHVAGYKEASERGVVRVRRSTPGT